MDFDKPLETGSDEEIPKLEKINKNLDTGVIEFETLPKELTAKGWILEKNKILIPINENNINYFTITKDKDTRNQPTYYYSFERKENNNKPYNLSESIQKAKFINIKDTNRNKEIIEIATDLELFEDQNTAIKFINSLLPEINKHNIKQLLNNNYDLLATIPEDIIEIDEKFKYRTFKDYPENIQKEAIKLHKTGNFLKNLSYTTNITHQGDTKQVRNSYYSYGSLFLKEPVHKFNSGDTGVGKTDSDDETLANVPDQYIQRYRTVSPKFIYYDVDNLHPKYNIFAFDDFKENSDNVETIKELADNKKIPKELKTVSTDRNSETYTINGYGLVSLNSAKQISDTEFLNRFFLEDIDNKESHKTKVKNKIKNNEVYNIKKSEILKRLRLINKCAFQYLIDKEMKVFNPYILFLDVSNINNRNIKGYISYIRARSFFFYEQRIKINNTVIGSFEDFKFIAKNIEKGSKKQNYKLTGLQEDIISMLPIYDENDIINIQNKAMGELEEAKKHTYTFDKLAKKLGKNKGTIMNAINGIKGASNPSLIDLGFINKKEFQPDTHRKDIFLYKTEKSKNNSNEDFNTNHVVYNENKLAFDTLNKKIILIYAFLTNHNILINTQLNIYINQFLERHKENLNSYEKICIFFNDFVENYETEFIEFNADSILEIEKIQYHFNTISKYQKKDSIHISLVDDKPENMISVKPKENNLNTKQDTKIQFKNNLNHVDYSKNSNGNHRRELHKIIYQNVKIKGTKQKPRLIENIQIPNDEILNYKVINKEIQYLFDNYYIEIDKLEITILAKFDKYYTEKLKNIKGDLQ